MKISGIDSGRCSGGELCHKILLMRFDCRWEAWADGSAVMQRFRQPRGQGRSLILTITITVERISTKGILRVNCYLDVLLVIIISIHSHVYLMVLLSYS